MVFRGKKSQGAFEYILLLGGVLLIVVVSIIILRGSVLNQANKQIGGNVNAWQDVTDASCYVSNYFLGTDLPDVSFEKGMNGWSGDGCANTVQDCTTSYDGSCSLRATAAGWVRPKNPFCGSGGTFSVFGPISTSEYKYLTFYYKLTAGSNACFMVYFPSSTFKSVARIGAASVYCNGYGDILPSAATLIADGNWHYIKIDLSSESGGYSNFFFKSDGVGGNYVWLDSYCARK